MPWSNACSFMLMVVHVFQRLSCLLCVAHRLFMCFRRSHACFMLLFHVHVFSRASEALMLVLCCSFVFIVC